MKRPLAVLFALLLGACQKDTEPVLPAIATTWVTQGDTSYFASTALSLTMRADSSLTGTATASLRCTTGQTTFTPRSTPSSWPCTLHGVVLDGSVHGATVSVLVAFVGAPVGATFTGLLGFDGTMRGSLDVRANTERYQANGVVFKHGVVSCTANCTAF